MPGCGVEQGREAGELRRNTGLTSSGRMPSKTSIICYNRQYKFIWGVLLEVPKLEISSKQIFNYLQLKPHINTELSSWCDTEQFPMSNKTTPQHSSHKVFEELAPFMNLPFLMSAAF